ncbi:hypothetical protein [Azospirillum brasilense]|uniref:Uncharacterized protein n=1 Tax=Azospirillum brasilense TaxID=192 RepID=A0A235H2M6_AZOBR|nr:hypothetical protein [Azospirillum brasilense]OYD80098.1 hypothetical protein CHT98_33015 [Azospirillum brasilense]
MGNRNDVKKKYEVRVQLEVFEEVREVPKNSVWTGVATQAIGFVLGVGASVTASVIWHYYADRILGLF